MTLEQALALAYRHLNRRERTAHEMRGHLLGRGAEVEVAEAVLCELSDQGYLDDARFARLFVQDKRDLNHWGSERIRRELLTRGVDRNVVESALVEGERAVVDREAAVDGEAAVDDEVAGIDSEAARALDVLRRSFPDGIEARRDSERALGILLRKGYAYEVAVGALSEHRRRTRCHT